MSISLKVDGIAGSSIEGCARQILNLSKKLEIMIEMDFNGYQLLAAPYMDIEGIIAAYDVQIEKPPESEETEGLGE